MIDFPRLAESHAYLAAALCPPQHQARAVETLAHAVGELLPKAERLPWRPTCPAELDAKLRKLHWRYQQGIAAGHIAVQVALERWMMTRRFTEPRRTPGRCCRGSGPASRAAPT